MENLLRVSDVYLLSALQMNKLCPTKEEIHQGRYYGYFPKDEAEQIIREFQRSPFTDYVNALSRVHTVIYDLKKTSRERTAVR